MYIRTWSLQYWQRWDNCRKITWVIPTCNVISTTTTISTPRVPLFFHQFHRWRLCPPSNPTPRFTRTSKSRRPKSHFNFWLWPCDSQMLNTCPYNQIWSRWETVPLEVEANLWRKVETGAPYETGLTMPMYRFMTSFHSRQPGFNSSSIGWHSSTRQHNCSMLGP